MDASYSMASHATLETNTLTSCSSTVSQAQLEVAFASFGGAVLDEIRIADLTIAEDSLGGAGTHATLGARLFFPPGESVAWQLQAGEDFPAEVEGRLQQWGIQLSIHRMPGVRSTRNVITYHDQTLSSKTFRYLSPIISLEPRDIQGTELISAKAFHFHVHPKLLGHQILDLQSLRDFQNIDLPFILWEPTRPSCISANLEACFEAVKLVDVFSPNHDELAALHDKQFTTFHREDLEKLAQKFVDEGIGHFGNGTIVVRAGEHGSLVLSRTRDPVWLPPFYEPGGTLINPKVVDTTGAGNSFLGGFAAGYLATGDVVTAAQYGSVAASYMLEQVALPQMSYSDETGDLWNGTKVHERLKEYQRRLDSSSTSDWCRL